MPNQLPRLPKKNYHHDQNNLKVPLYSWTPQKGIEWKQAIYPIPTFSINILFHHHTQYNFYQISSKSKGACTYTATVQYTVYSTVQ